MSQLRILVSHSHKDNAFCQALVTALREAGADVWYDESNLGAGRLRRVIMNELTSRLVFIVVLSKAAMKSEWVKEECEWAYNLYRRQRNRIILPVLAGPIKQSDFNRDWLYFEGFTRVGGFNPLPQQEAIERTLRYFSLPVSHQLSGRVASNPSISGELTVGSAQSSEPSGTMDAVLLDDAYLGNVLLARGKVLSAQGKPDIALPFLQCATQLRPGSFNAWMNLGWALDDLGNYMDAESAFERADALPPEDGVYPPEDAISAWFGKGHALNNMGRFEEALAAFNQLAALEPDWAHAWVCKGMVLGNIGVTEHNAGRLQESLDALNHALELQPSMLDEGTALGLKAKTLRALGRTAEAEELDERSRKLRSEGLAARMAATDSNNAGEDQPR